MADASAALAAGGFTLGGVVVGYLLQDLRDKKADKRALRNAKAERLRKGSSVATTGPAVRCCGGIAYDATVGEGYLVSFGGASYDNMGNEKEYADTWFWKDTGSWCQLGPSCP